MQLACLTPETAPSPADAHLKSAKEKLGFVPNMYGHMANMPAFLEQYLDGYRRFREQSGFTPIEQEVIFLTISRANDCDYCTAAHSMVADKLSNVPSDVLEAARTGDVIPDKKLNLLAILTEELVAKRGNVDSIELAAAMDVGYSVKQVLAIVLAISTKVLSNYMNHLVGTNLDEAFADYAVSEVPLNV